MKRPFRILSIAHKGPADMFIITRGLEGIKKNLIKENNLERRSHFMQNLEHRRN